MRIGITCHSSAGGSGILATELGHALAERGHEIHFVTFDPPFRLTHEHPNIFCHLVQFVSYPLFNYPPFSLALTTKICEVADEFRIELWHAHYAIPYAAAALAARYMLPPDKQFKIVTTLHGTDITIVGSDPSFWRMTQYTIKESDAATAVSNWLAEETQREFALESRPRTIYNFVNPDKFVRDPSQLCNLATPHEKIVMHISNFRPVKRVTDVVRVFKKVCDQIPARLVMVGDGPERISAVGVAKQLGISDRITYLGTHANVEHVLPCADLVFQPSEHESFGLVPLEAMGCEVPVIGTASGGICEVVEHGVTGYLCEVGDIDTMARYAIDLLTNPEKAKEMGRRGRERAITLFSQDRIVSQYEELYCELAGPRGQQGR